MSQYYVTQNGQPIGQLEIKEILKRIENNSIQLNDYIFDPEKNSWEIILLSNIIDDQYKMIPPQKLKNNDEKSNQEQINFWENKDWFVFKDNKQEGPFTYFDVLKLLQTNYLFDYDFIWTQGLSTWVKIHEVPVFSEEHIKKLSLSDNFKIQSAFFRRQFPRIKMNHPIYLHDYKKLYKGNLVELSAGGCGVMISDDSHIGVSDQVILHVIPGSHKHLLPTFNALAEVVSRKKKNNEIKIGLKFEALNQDIYLKIRLLTERKAA